jgi:hypothetical protein
MPTGTKERKAQAKGVSDHNFEVVRQNEAWIKRCCNANIIEFLGGPPG